MKTDLRQRPEAGGAVPPEPRPRRDIGPAGTTGRILIGAASLGWAGWLGIRWQDAVIGLAGVPAAVTLLLALRGRSAPALRTDTRWAPAVMLGTVIGGAALVALASPQAALLFFGISSLLAGLRGYRDCEVTAVPNLLLGRADRIPCCLFTPVDALEVRGRQGGE